MTQRFSIAGKVYDAVDVTGMTMKDMLQFERETADFGRPLTWSEVLSWHDEISALPPAEQSKHPQMIWITAVSIWAARRAAGESVTFEQAIDIPAAEIKLISGPEDHKPKAAAGKARARKATGRPGDQPG